MKLEINNMNDNRPKFIDKNGEEISRLDIYFNGVGKCTFEFFLTWTFYLNF